MPTTATVNGHSAEYGCYIAGHWGQYAVDRTAEIAESFGIVIDADRDPRVLRDLALNTENENESMWLWHSHYDASDDIVAALNDATDKESLWHWIDGELFLSSMADLASMSLDEF